MPEQTKYTTLEDYARHIYAEMQNMTARLCVAVGPDSPASLQACRLSQEAYTILQQRRMQDEAAGVDALDLSKMPPPSFAEDED